MNCSVEGRVSKHTVISAESNMHSTDHGVLWCFVSLKHIKAETVLQTAFWNTFSSMKGLAPDSRQVIIWTSIDVVCERIYASLNVKVMY